MTEPTYTYRPSAADIMAGLERLTDVRRKAREAVTAWETWTNAGWTDDDAATHMDAAMTALREVAT